MLSWFRRNKPAPPASSPATAPTSCSVDGDAHRKRGNALLEQGQLAAAEEAYRQAVALGPANSGAWVNLGFLLTERGAFDAAKDALERAAALDPTDADAQYLLGRVKLSLDDVAGAIANFDHALKVRSDFEPCRRDLCLAHVRLGDFAAANRTAALGIAIDPQAAELHQIMGNLHTHAGDLVAATLSCRTALSLSPDVAQVQANLGKALHEQGELTEAVACYRRALQLQPEFVEAQRALAVLLHKQGQPAAAVQAYRSVLVSAPTDVDALSNLGSALTDLHRLTEARAVLTEAIRIDPRHAHAHVNLGIVINNQSDLDGAQASFEFAIGLDPGRAAAHSNLGAVLQKQGRLAAARTSYEQAISLSPDSADAHSNLGLLLQEMGAHEPAVQSLRQALALAPDHAAAQDNLLFTLNYHPDKTASEIFSAYREYDQRVGLPLRGSWTEHTNARDATRRLKVGYVSPDLRQHSVRHFLEPLLANHDKRAFEVFAYAELSIEDAATARYRAYADRWVLTAGLSNDALAERIRADSIDILVDLAGHTTNNRLVTFARKPAPVSLSWLGFGYTTGLSAIDYLLTDDTSAPQGSEDLFAEQLWRLPTPGFAYRPAEGMGEVNALPAGERGFVTFGTLTRAVRVNHRTIRAWSQILQRVPKSRLVVDSLTYRDEAVRTTLLEQFSAHGISPERLQIGFHTPPWDMLRGIDIGLDCFPHNSGTTLFETLYMGLPYVTLAGRPSVGRLGSSILIGVGHPEWIARSEDEYVDSAVALASGLPALASLRAGLRAQMRDSALMDEAGFARKVEAAYREMFARWAAT